MQESFASTTGFLNPIIVNVLVDELEVVVEADFGVKAIPWYEIVTPGICPASSSVWLIAVGKELTFNPLSISVKLYEIPFISNVSLLFAISVSIALIIAVFNELGSLLIASAAVLVL